MLITALLKHVIIHCLIGVADPSGAQGVPQGYSSMPPQIGDYQQGPYNMQGECHIIGGIY